MTLPILFILLLSALQSTGSRYVVGHFVELTGIRSTAVSAVADGSVFVLDQEGNSVRHFGKSFDIRYTIGGTGVGQTEFDDPTDITSTFLLELYVVDRNNRRIQVFDQRGNYIRTVDDETIRGLSGRFQPRACGVSTNGDLFVIDTDGNRIVVIDPRGVMKDEFGAFHEGRGALRAPIDIIVTEKDEVAVLDGDRLMFFDIFGNYVARFPLEPSVEWKRINLNDRTITVIAHDRISVISTDRKTHHIIRHSDVAGLPGAARLSDAFFSGQTLVILADSTLYTCPANR